MTEAIRQKTAPSSSPETSTPSFQHVGALWPKNFPFTKDIFARILPLLEEGRSVLEACQDIRNEDAAEDRRDLRLAYSSRN